MFGPFPAPAGCLQAVQESSDADLTMDEVLELEPEEPRGPPTTPDPSFFESAPTNESHDEILVDYEPFEECVPKTPAASAVPEPKEAICPAEEAICQTETPAAAPTEEVSLQPCVNPSLLHLPPCMLPLLVFLNVQLD